MLTDPLTYSYFPESILDTTDRVRMQGILNGGHVRIALVHLLKDGFLGEYFVESDMLRGQFLTFDIVDRT